MGTKTRKLAYTTGKDYDWQPTKYADGSTIFNIESGQGFLLDTTGGQIEVVLPSSPQINDTVAIVDVAGTFATNRVLLSGNGNNIRSLPIDAQLNTNNTQYKLIYVDATQGWIVIETKTVSVLGLI